MEDVEKRLKENKEELEKIRKEIDEIQSRVEEKYKNEEDNKDNEADEFEKEFDKISQRLEEIKDKVSEARKEGKDLLITTHYISMSEVWLDVAKKSRDLRDLKLAAKYIEETKKEFESELEEGEEVKEKKEFEIYEEVYKEE